MTVLWIYLRCSQVYVCMHVCICIYIYVRLLYACISDTQITGMLINVVLCSDCGNAHTEILTIIDPVALG